MRKSFEPTNLFVPDPKTGGYREGFLESGAEIADIGAEGADLAKKLVVAVGENYFLHIFRNYDCFCTGHEKFTHKAAEVGRVNPPKVKLVTTIQTRLQI